MGSSTKLNRKNVYFFFQPAGLNTSDLKSIVPQILFFSFSLRQIVCMWGQLDALLNIKMLSKALIFKLCTAVTPWIGIEVSWVVTQGGSS